MTAQKGLSYTAGHFELQLDGQKSSAYLKSVEGGEIHAESINEAVGTGVERIKHSSVAKVEPFSIEFGISAAWDILTWIQRSWKKDFSRTSGMISHANFNLQKTFEHEFYDALITETSFPELNGAAKEPAYMKIKFQPENVRMKLASGEKLQASSSEKQKMWLPSAFRFVIDGLEELSHTNKIEAFTIKQGIKEAHNGEDRLPQIEPTKLEFPDLIGTVSMAYSKGLMSWYDSAVVKGIRENTGQKTGAIEFLAPNKSDVIFRINLFEVGIKRVSVVAAKANEDQIKRVKFELYVGRMALDGKGKGFS